MIKMKRQDRGHRVAKNKDKRNNRSEADPKNYLMLTEFKKYLDETKTTFNTLKLLFQDIKTSTSSKEVIKSLDIDDIKNNILELENKIKAFKIHLQKELTALKSAERQINQKLNDPVTIKYLKRKPRVQTAKYTEIVQSPVKTLMTSPLKSTEVHEFQEFMKNSRNRYGGWDEYHHNIFVNMWQKHFSAEFLYESVLTMEKTSEYNLFLRHLLPKLIGVSEAEVTSHINWYIKFLHLKDHQQKAIDKWRSNRRKMKPSNMQKDNYYKNKSIMKKTHTGVCNDNIDKRAQDDLIHQDDLMFENGESRFSVRFTRKCVSDEMQHESMTNKEFVESDEVTKFHFLKTTRQWNIRCCNENVKSEKEFTNIENIQKL
ncbi:unnamed protein product [Arctia plantaginis]|uniref:Uncharacterized protein n=1 Tax=Arctia plantaginis TaxID=874455 RepID=A0A8S0ZSG6_ARCPL|nr:unnamed protein product [Arctia plantaginis]